MAGVDSIGIVERIATANDWPVARPNEEELTLVVAGNFTDYQLSLTWMSDIEALHIACAFELKISEPRRHEAIELVAKINVSLWVGHFDLWFQDGLVMYRDALLLTGDLTATKEQCEHMIATGVNACEQYFQAFQFVVWAGKSAQEAFDAVNFQTDGNA